MTLTRDTWSAYDCYHNFHREPSSFSVYFSDNRFVIKFYCFLRLFWLLFSYFLQIENRFLTSAKTVILNCIQTSILQKVTLISSSEVSNKVVLREPYFFSKITMLQEFNDIIFLVFINLKGFGREELIRHAQNMTFPLLENIYRRLCV